MTAAPGSDAKSRVFVMLPLHILNGETNAVEYAKTPSTPLGSGPQYDKLTDKEKWLLADLVRLREADVQGVMVDCWWGIVEAKRSGEYNWDGYKNLFSIVKKANLELHVVMSFHACVENRVETIPLPGWVKSIGDDKDLFYKDAHGIPSTEYLSWTLADNNESGNQFSPVQVYKKFMSEFKANMREYLPGTITMIEVGLGPCGELRYPAYRSAWKPGPPAGIGAFQCYNQEMMELWNEEAKGQNSLIPCRVGPQTAGDYNSKPDETQFFMDQPGLSLTNGTRYSDDYGKKFLTWYSTNLVDHGSRVLKAAKEVFQTDVNIAAKVPGIYWYCGTESRAAEATAGLFTGDNLSVYKLIAGMLKEMGATFIFTCVEKKDINKTDKPETLVTQVLGEAQPENASIACENGSAAYEEKLYNQIFAVATARKISYFTYMRLCSDLMTNLGAFEIFVKKMNDFFNNLSNASTSQPPQ